MRISCLDSHVVRGCWAHSKFYIYYFILISDWVKEPKLSLSMSNYLTERSGLKTVMDLDITLRNCQIGIREQLETYNANHKRMNVQNASQRQTKNVVSVMTICSPGFICPAWILKCMMDNITIVVISM